jgi:predicted HAD superfamily Cof-like phosphohydrolase
METGKQREKSSTKMIAQLRALIDLMALVVGWVVLSGVLSEEI